MPHISLRGRPIMADNYPPTIYLDQMGRPMSSRQEFLQQQQNQCHCTPGATQRCYVHNRGANVATIPSLALWCDEGKHAFSSKDPDKRRRTEETETLDRYGDPQKNQEEFYTCGDCSRRIKKLLNDAGRALQEKTQALEEWNEGYQEGLRANPTAQSGERFEPPF